jgi:hypothetical protein
MIVVYLKNGEKAPMPDADDVKLEAGVSPQALMLRCFFGGREVGQFKWEEVAGYTISVLVPADLSPARAYEAWGVNQ